MLFAGFLCLAVLLQGAEQANRIFGQADRGTQLHESLVEISNPCFGKTVVYGFPYYVF